MILYGLLGGASTYLCAMHVAKLGGSGGMLPQEILILDLLLDAIWWAGVWDCFNSHKHNLLCH